MLGTELLQSSKNKEKTILSLKKLKERYDIIGIGNIHSSLDLHEMFVPRGFLYTNKNCVNGVCQCHEIT